MQLLLIKIGKAWNVLRRDGIGRGGKRILAAFGALFRKVEPGEILFISNGVGDSARYRTTHVAEELTYQGFKTAVTVQDNPFLLTYVDKFSVFVFHRVFFTEKVAKFVAAIKAQGKTIVFETDDLVYDPAFLPLMDSYQQMNVLEKKLYEHGLGGEILMDPYVEAATTTTTFLADKLREKGKRVFVVKNKLSKQDVVWADKALAEINSKFKIQNSKIIRIGYLSGTPSHNKDFSTITPVLVELLTKYPQIRLVLAGPLDTDNTLHQFSDRIERVAFVPRKELFGVIAALDINVAPLEMSNPFCESKSELKWFEAGIVGVPTVAAATQTFREAITDGVDGFVAATALAWEEKLERLIVSTEEREQMGEQARQSVLARYTTKSVDAVDYVEYIRLRINL